MKLILYFYLFLICISCNTETKSKSQPQNEGIRIVKNEIKNQTDSNVKRENKKIKKIPENIFNDSLFSYINIDSISGNFIRKHVFKYYYYDFKKWKNIHFEYFKIDKSNYDFGCYLIAKQKNINPDIFGVIDLRCPPLDGSTGYLYTINKRLEKIDSIEVVNFSCGGEEGCKYYSKEILNTHFNKNMLDIERLFYTCSSKNDSCTLDSLKTIKAKILEDGKIKIIEEDK